MVSISENLRQINEQLEGNATLVAVSKTKPIEMIMEAYNAGQRIFGENKVQELVEKYEALPDDIQWHMIGHLQRNKVKHIAPFVDLIHGVDSMRLLRAIDKQGVKIQHVINCLLQIHIASEETKFGLDKDELVNLLESEEFMSFKNIRIKGLMGMASFSSDKVKVGSEFHTLKQLYDEVKAKYFGSNLEFAVLSMGMSGDYDLALKEGSNMVRIGTSIFGDRNCHV